MPGEVLVAIAVSSLLAVFSLPLGYFHCWWSWSRPWCLAAVVLHGGLVGIIGGVLGWVTAQAFKNPTFGLDSWFLVGFIYGLIGSVFVLADAKTLLANKSTGSTSEVETEEKDKVDLPAGLKEAVSIVGFSARSWTSALDNICKSRANKWLGALDGKELLAHADWLRGEIAGAELDPAPKRALMRLIVPAMEEFSTKDRAFGFSQIVAFGRRIVVSLHLERPTEAQVKALLRAATATTGDGLEAGQTHVAEPADGAESH